MKALIELSARMRQRLLLAAIAIAYLAMYARTASYAFVWDDVHEIANNPSFDGSLLDGLATTQTERTDPSLTQLASIELHYDSYRPLVFASLWLDVQLWGRDARAMHVTNVVLGLLAIFVAYALARRWLGTRALIPTAIFALHPAQVETVAYISGRSDLLAGLLVMATAWCTLACVRAESRRAIYGWATAGAATFAAALLSKESAAGAPVAIALLLLATGALRSRWWLPVLYVAVLGGYLVLRAALVTPTTTASLADAMFELPAVWLQYARIAILPLDLSTERLASTNIALAWTVVVIMLGGFAVALRFASTRAAWWTSLAGFAWFACLLGPSAVAVASSGVAADRYLYAPLFGLATALTAAATELVRLRRWLSSAVVAIAVVWGALLIFVAWRQVPVWRDNSTLYAHAVAMEPGSSLAHYRLGYLAARVDDWETAIPLFERAVELDPNNVRALNNLGVGLLRTQRFAPAVEALSRAVRINPALFRSWSNLGLAQLGLGKTAEGCASLARANEINPQYQPARAYRERYCAGATSSGR